jgi:hypothetical protein
MPQNKENRLEIEKFLILADHTSAKYRIMMIKERLKKKC